MTVIGVQQPLVLAPQEEVDAEDDQNKRGQRQLGEDRDQFVGHGWAATTAG
jgi:hypothetical protein